MSAASMQPDTANRLTNVKDIRNRILYTKDGYAIVYLRVYPFNMDLLSPDEIRSITTQLTGSFRGEQQNMVYFSLPREVDLDAYKGFLEEKYMSEIGNHLRKQIIRDMVNQASDLTNAGDTYEHQHFIRLYQEVSGNESFVENDLVSRAMDFIERYETVGIKLDILEDVEILKICNLFGNAGQAVTDSTITDTRYTAMTRLGG